MYIIKPEVFYLVTSLSIHLKGRMTCCAYYYFNETIFPLLGGKEPDPEEWCEIIQNALTFTYLDLCTNQCELEVQMINYFQNFANQLPDAFIETKKVTKSYILAANIPTQIDVPIGQIKNESKIRLKHGRLVGSKNS